MSCKPVELGHLALRSEEHTSELQSRSDLVCRLLLEKKKIKSTILFTIIRVSLDTFTRTRHFMIVLLDIKIKVNPILKDFIGLLVNLQKKVLVLHIL